MRVGKNEDKGDKDMAKKMMKKISAPVLAGTIGFLGSACGTSPEKRSQVKVTNGKKISESNFPSVVLLVMQTAKGQSICTGTFVNDRQLLTAGHCVASLDLENPSLYYVTMDYDENGEMYYQAIAQAESIAINPRYSLTRDNGVNGSDVSVVNFPSNTAPAVSKISALSIPNSSKSFFHISAALYISGL